MTEIKIKRLVLENFKCHRFLRLDFDGRNATIYGDNAVGKTSIYDALTWLLFGKTRFVEDGINGLFRTAKFRLFREQANGGTEERCDVVYDGVPYMGLNSGAKINVGIDIINTLSRHYGVAVPLFVDNAESVTHLENAATQVVRLVVSESDKELRCEYEN